MEAAKEITTTEDNAANNTGSNSSSGGGGNSGGVKPGVSHEAGGVYTVTETETDFEGNVISIVNGVIGVLGLVCVVVMIIGGVNYLTSAGDSGKVEKGKKTILYGLIGLVICVLAFAVVNFVISNIIGGGSE